MLKQNKGKILKNKQVLGIWKLLRGIIYIPSNHKEVKRALRMLLPVFQVFSIDVYALLYPDATLCFVSPLVAMKFCMLPDV